MQNAEQSPEFPQRFSEGQTMARPYDREGNSQKESDAEVECFKFCILH
jgi:hypothetical protein